MRILILGAGQVGGTVAENLAGENHDVTLVDQSQEVLTELEDRLDIRVVRGHAAHPAILEQAGVVTADLVLAVTSNDETNIVACEMAAKLGGEATTDEGRLTRIARIREPAYLARPELLQGPGNAIDVLINPEQLVTDYVEQLIRFPGALQVLDFAHGKVQLVGIRTYEGGPLVGHTLATLRQHMPHTDVRVAAIYRGGKSIMPTGETVIEDGDEVFFLSATRDIRAVMAEFGRVDRPVKRVIIAGGGHIGRRLAEALEDHYNIKIIERDAERARFLAENLKKTLVLHGSAADEELLSDENIEHTDVFCAVTNDEEANILSSMLAKRAGARLVMALILRASYVDLVQSSTVDVAISPKLATISRLLAFVRRGDVVVGHSLRRGAAEAIEAVAHGTAATSKVIGRRIGDIKLPPGTTIGAVVRGDKVLMGHKLVTIESDDHVILFLVDKRHVPAVEALFQDSSSKPRRLRVRSGI